MIRGINHVNLSVRSLSESFEFYRDVLGFKPLMKNQKSAYFLAGDLWFCIEEDPQTRSQALPEYTHIAFSVAHADFPELAERIRRSGAKVFKENKSEGDSLYFVDPSGHKLEVHVGDWKSRMAEYRESNPAGMEFFE